MNASHNYNNTPFRYITCYSTQYSGGVHALSDKTCHLHSVSLTKREQEVCYNPHFRHACLSYLEPKPAMHQCLYNLYTVLTGLVTIAISRGSCILLHHPQRMDENRRFHRRFQVKKCKLDHLYIPKKHSNRAQQAMTIQWTPKRHGNHHLLAMILIVVTKHKHIRWPHLSGLLGYSVFSRKRASAGCLGLFVSVLGCGSVLWTCAPKTVYVV